MKVKLGPYKNWFGPHQLAEMLCFWAKNEPDEFGIQDKPDWVHDFGEWLAYGSVKKDDDKDIVLLNKEKRDTTWLYKFLLWIDRKKERVERVHIDRWDTWNMDRTLGLIILPMLKQLKENQHGAPFVDDEDVPEELRSTSAPPKENEYDTDENHFKRWEWALGEMIFAFEHIVDDSWEDEFHSGKSEIYFEKTEDGEFYEMKRGENDTHKYDFEGRKKIDKRIGHGLVLFGKYYRGLWD